MALLPYLTICTPTACSGNASITLDNAASPLDAEEKQTSQTSERSVLYYTLSGTISMLFVFINDVNRDKLLTTAAMDPALRAETLTKVKWNQTMTTLWFSMFLLSYSMVAWHHFNKSEESPVIEENRESIQYIPLRQSLDIV